MLPEDHQHLIINVSIVVDKKVNKLDHKDLLLAEGSREGGVAGGITSLCSGSGRLCRLIGALSRSNLNAECAHEISCLVDSAVSLINYRSRSFGVMGERGYDAEELLNLTNICENLPRRLNRREHYHSHLTTVFPGEEGREFRLVLRGNRRGMENSF